MLQNKKTPSDVVKPFRSVPNDPQVLQKRFEKHKPQRLIIRVSGNDLPPDRSLSFKVTSRLLEELPEECYVGLESFCFIQSTTLDSALTAMNITSPLFVSGRQYETPWNNNTLGGQYSSIIATVPNNYTIININNTGLSYQSYINDHYVGCFNTNKNILNNFEIPFTITDQIGNTYTVPQDVGGQPKFSLQFTLVFYGYNDDERYSMLPNNIPR